MKQRWQILSLLLVAGLSFHLGSITTTPAGAQTAQAQKRDAQGRFVPVPQGPFPARHSSFGVVGNIVFRVSDISPDSPAEQLGLQKGDVITAIDGKQFYSINDYIELLAEKMPGEKVDVEYLRLNGATCRREHKTGQTTMAPPK
jgi:S1-C subfamily serine protease